MDEEKILSPLKAIRAKCLDCSCGNPNEVRLCPIEKCPLYIYRSGHRPKKDGEKREMTAAQQAALLKARNSLRRPVETQ
jgi:hypothetical protein